MKLLKTEISVHFMFIIIDIWLDQVISIDLFEHKVTND